MVDQIQLTADLELELQVPGGDPVTGSLRGSGTHLELRVSGLAPFSGRGDSATIGRLAGLLSETGLTVAVIAPSGPLLTLGAPHPPWWQRWVTGSRHIRLQRGALWTLARGRAQASAAGALPSSRSLPPATPWPVVPTLFRRGRNVTTTHDPARGGNPRLIRAPGTAPGPDDVREVFALSEGVTTIGSDPGNDVRLPGLEPWHAEVHHDARDEFLLHRVCLPGGALVNGEEVDQAMLRTGTRVQLETWTLSFARDEHADHGRPHGGRQGGELGQNHPQPSRHPARREGEA